MTTTYLEPVATRPTGLAFAPAPAPGSLLIARPGDVPTTLPAMLALLPRPLHPVAAAYASTEPPIGAQVTEFLTASLIDLLSRTAQLLGQRTAFTDAGGEDVELMARALAALLQREFARLKLPEVTEAFQRGTGGAYRSGTEIDFVALPVFARWLRGYCEAHRSQVHLAAQEAAGAWGRSCELPADHPVHVAGYVEGLVRLVHQQRAGILPSGALLDPGTANYEHLKAWGVINMGSWRPAGWWAHIQKQEAAALRTEEKTAAATAPAWHGPELRTGAKNLEEALKSGNFGNLAPKHEARLKNACRRRALREWLEDVAADGDEDAPFSENALRAMLATAAAGHYPPYTPTPDA